MKTDRAGAQIGRRLTPPPMGAARPAVLPEGLTCPPISTAPLPAVGNPAAESAPPLSAIYRASASGTE